MNKPSPGTWQTHPEASGFGSWGLADTDTSILVWPLGVYATGWDCQSGQGGDLHGGLCQGP